MNIARTAAIGVGAAGISATVGWVAATRTPEPLNDGITRRELPPAIGLAVFSTIMGGIAGPALMAATHIHDPVAPKFGASIVTGLAAGLGFGLAAGLGLASSESYDWPMQGQN